MTRVALYARYSSEGQREASIDDQFRTCVQYAARQDGWMITARYQDQAISGTKGETGRDGYKAMLADARAKRFDVLLVDDLSRLTRDEAELIKTRKLLVFLGLRLVGPSDGFDTAQKSHKIQASFHGIKNEQYLDELAEKTHRGLMGQALKGHNTGGRCYGYTHVPVTDPTQTDEYGRPKIVAVKRQIDAAQAKWIRQIFTWYADGYSPRWIAGELNRLKIPAPGAAYKRKNRRALHGTWSASALHGDAKQGTGLLHNPLCIGRMIWNRRDWVINPETQTKVPRVRPESEWIKTDLPDLRILDQALWDRVQARQRSRPEMRKATPATNVKYLLSGLLKCNVCGSSFVMAGAHHYACAGHLNRGNCSNMLRVRRELVEAKCLEGLRNELLTPERVALFITETTRLWAERQQERGATCIQAETRLAVVEQELANLVAAIKQGILTATTKAELEKAEAERRRLLQTLASGKTDKVVSLLPRLKEKHDALVAHLSALPSRGLAPMREQIRELVGEFKLVPTANGTLEAHLVGRYEGLLKLAVGGNSVGCGGRI